MLQYLLQKMKSKKWLMFAMLIGNILLLSIVCCIRMYPEAITQRTIERSMASFMEENKEYPAKLTLTSSLTVVNSSRNNAEKFQKIEQLANSIKTDENLPVSMMITNYSVTAQSETLMKRNGDPLKLNLELGCLSDLENHIELVSGNLYDEQPVDGVISAIVSEKMLASNRLILGETLKMTKLKDSDGNPLKVRIDGVFRCSDYSDAYWVKSPSSYESMMFLPEQLFQNLFVHYDSQTYSMRGNWYLLFDYKELKRENINHLLKVTEQCSSFAQQETAYGMSENYSQNLTTFLSEDHKTSTTLWVLQVPILILLAAFISMVSKQMLSLEQTEIAVLKSRGLSQKQIIGLYLGQSTILGFASWIVAIPLGALLCQVLGSANAFLEFVGRKALEVHIFTWDIFIFCLITTLVSICVTVFPVIQLSHTSIVGHRHKKAKKHNKPFWQRYYLDVVILAIGCYGKYVFGSQQELLIEKVLAGGSLDPFLYLSSSLFIIGSGLLSIRIIQLLITVIFAVTKQFLKPDLYASFLRATRTKNEKNFIIVFLILTIALGIFHAKTARTINENDESNLRYETGADVVLQEEWTDNQKIVDNDPTGTIALSYQEPSFDEYLSIKGVNSATKVYQGNASVTFDGGTMDAVSLMGIDTKEFGETAYMPDGVTDHHWYHYLNAMTASAYDVLVSESFRENAGYQLGDTIYYSVEGYQTRGIICGFFDYWPGFQTNVTIESKHGNFEVPNYQIIAHRAQIQSLIGVRPYQVYLKFDGNTSGIYDYIAKSGKVITSFEDATQKLVAHKNDSVLQGTNGMLTVGFITVLVLCIIGFLIYWVINIKSRTLQFGIFRAMGMTMHEVMKMIISEQLCITGISVLLGVFIGKLASDFYIPLIQIAYYKEKWQLPLRIIGEPMDTVRILAVVLIMMIGCILILRTMIKKTNVTQAIKLGED